MTQTSAPTRIGTVLGTPPAAAPVSTILTPKPAAPVVVVGAGPIGTGSIPLHESRVAEAQSLLDRFDLTTATPAVIVSIGGDAERALQATYDGFLVRLDKGNAAPVFALFDRLETGVNEADLPAILKDVQSTKPNWLDVAFGLFRLKGPKAVAKEAYERVSSKIKTSTGALTEKMKAMEGELDAEMKKLLGEIEQIEALKRAYETHFNAFAFEAAVAQAYVAKAKEQVAQRERELSGSHDLQALEGLRELQGRFQLLQSRALALEGTYTKLPTSSLIIDQIRDAGVQTFQETMITSSAQFGDIKMTLLMIHGAFSVKSVQDLGAKRAALSSQLQEVRGQLMGSVVATAANAAGDNRLAQAEQIQKAIDQATLAQQTVKKARELNEAKFDTAREMFASARRQIAALGNGTAAQP